MRYLLKLAGVCAALCALPLPAFCTAQTPTTDPSQQEMRDEIKALRAEVQELQARVSAVAPTTRPAPWPDVNGVPGAADTAASVQKDAATHDDLGLGSGYLRDKGFYLRSEDGNFLLHPWAFFQFRGTANYRDHAPDGSSDSESGFEIPRLKLILDGNLYSKDLTYQFIWATSDTTGNLGLQDAWARYHFPGTPFAVEAGQIRNPLDHEQIVYATKSLTADRSIVNSVLLNGDDIVKGVELSYGYDTNESVGIKAAFTSGQENFDTTFQDYPTNGANWGVVGRVEWKIMGDWVDYSQFSSLQDKAPLLVLGAGADYTEAGPAATLTHVVDAQYNLPDGLALYGAYLGRYTRNNAGAPDTNGNAATGSTITPADTYDGTVRLMAAYLVNKHFEPFIRYEYIQFDAHEFTARSSNVQDYTIGFNYYLAGQRAKFTVNATYLPNGSPIDSTLNDLLPTQRGTELIFQAQFQLIL